MLFTPARIFRICLPLFALLASTIVAAGADPVVSPLSTNPRYTGSPVVRTWLAEDFGGSPISFRAVQQPGTGFIYVANERGVLEFDGVRWRLIRAPKEQLVSSVGVDRLGRVWGCGGSEIFRLEPDARGELQARSMLAQLPGNFRTALRYFDSVPTADGVYFCDNKNVIFFGLDEGPAQVWPVAEGNVVIIDLYALNDELHVQMGQRILLRRRNGRFEPAPELPGLAVLASRPAPDGALHLMGNTTLDRWEGTRYTTLQSPLAGDAAQAATFLADGRMVFATRNSGLIVCDSAGRFLQKIDRAKGLPANNVTSVIEDHEGGVWATLRYGIARVQLDTPYARHGPAQGLEGTVVSLVRIGEELFAGGTENVVRRGPAGTFRPVEGAPGPDREIVAQGERLYILGPRLRSLIPALGNAASELENRNYAGLVPITSAPGWFAHGSNEGLRWAHFAGEKWVSMGPLKTRIGNGPAMLEAPADVIWCSSNGVAWRVDFRTGLRAEAPAQRFGPAQGMPGAPNGMFLLGREIVATVAGKLVRFNETTGRFEPETRIAGLEGFHIERAHRGRDGLEWLQGGPPTREIRRLVAETADRWRAEKLPGEPLARLLPTTLFQDDATQTLWIGGHGALISRDLTWQPTRVIAPPAATVRRIETAEGQLLVAGGTASTAATVREFAPEQDALRIAFAAPSYRPDHAGVTHTHYRTRLDGLDREWSAWSKQSERDFTNLPWRAFTFRVQARDDEGRIGPETQIAFSLRPAWWATGWAWTAYGALGLLGFAGAVRLRTQVIHRRAERLETIITSRTRELADSNTMLATSNAQLAMSNAELARLRQLELDEKITAQLAEEKARLEVLRYQLNPHFLYNALNSIYGLVYENARDAGEMVLRLSEFCRSTLTGATDELPRLEGEIAALRSYLDVEKVRWRDRLQIDYDLAPDVAAIQLPPFLLLPLVENAIKHGARTSDAKMQLIIRAFSEEPIGRTPPEGMPATVVIEIINSGEWLPPDPTRPGSTGIGLENLRQRLRRYYPNAHTFAIEAKDGWVTVRVRLATAGLRDRTVGKAPATAAVP